MKPNFLKTVAVLGAFGKMGSGISLLALTAIAEQELSSHLSFSSYRLYLVDIQDDTYHEILSKIRKHLLQYAEKNIQNLRQYYATRTDLIENHQIIEEFIFQLIGCLRVTTDINSIKTCQLVFEAASENLEIKTKLLITLKNNCSSTPYFLTNTSSIPIHILATKTGLENRIIGYHFYNPPQKQKLVELVIPTNTETELKDIAAAITKLMKKTTIPSADIAGFIGNGHFMREILYATQCVQQQPESLFSFDSITRDFLCRPMGIFQLVDYVGIDVCQSILTVMSTYLQKKLDSTFLNTLLAAGIRGGQNPNGSQKNGIFQYEQGKITAYYSLTNQSYTKVPAFESKKIITTIYPAYQTWKELIAQNQAEKDQFFHPYFQALFHSSEPHAVIAKQYLQASRTIAEELVKDGVAAHTNDVNSVLQLGFQHPYGPVNTYY